MRAGAGEEQLGRVVVGRGPPRCRAVFATLGSWGDVLPYLAIARGLRARGHEVALATSACHRGGVEAAGVCFLPLRPDSGWAADPTLLRRRGDPHLGLLRVLQEWLLPALPDTFHDLRAAAWGADLLVSHPLAGYAARLVAETTGVPWASTVVAPLGLFSAHEAPALPMPAFLLEAYRWLGPWLRRLLLRLCKVSSRFLARPWLRLRERLGLPPAPDDNPLSDSHSPLLVLALFSRMLAERQPDWPPQTVITGFPAPGPAEGVGLPGELARFLDEGPSPVVFTLGTAMGADAGGFFETSLEAARRLGLRAALIGPRGAGPQAGGGAIAVEYSPYGELFPRAAAVVNHGGAGTIGQAMRAGLPMLVVPTAWDQPDNAARVERLGVARVLPRQSYTAPLVASELRLLLGGPYRARAREVAERARGEDGAQAACDALEGLLAAPMLK